MTITVYYFYYCILILLLTCPLRHSSLVISKTTDTSVECNNCNGMRSKDVVVMAATDVSSTALSNISTAAVTASTATTTTSTPNTATTTLKMQIAMFKQKLQLPNIPAMLKQAVHKVMELIRSLLPVRKTTQNTTQMDVPALPTEPQLPNVTKDAVNQSLTLQMQTWAGKNITSEEIEQIQEMRNLITSCTTCQSQWIQHVEDIELLRFLRAKHNHVSNAWKFILQHDQWRVSSFGAESSFVRDIFNNQNNSDAKNPLRKEAFWIAPTEHQCPTLVLRTQVHDGYYYNDDPRIYVAYLVHLLEEGKRLYGVGTKHELCVLLDRAGTVYKNGEPKVEKLDRSVIPALIELFRLLYSTILDHYPELVTSVKIAPTSWFFSFCYSITSRVMSSHHRAMFQMIKSDEISKKLHPWINPEYLPEHLGGTSATYTSTVNVEFDPHRSRFPITTTPGYRKADGKPTDHKVDANLPSSTA